MSMFHEITKFNTLTKIVILKVKVRKGEIYDRDM